LLRRGEGHVGGCWIRQNKPSEDRINEVCARPLQQDFRKEHEPRIARLPPRQIVPTVLAVPGQQLAVEPALVLGVDDARSLPAYAAR
jgi:hypothetical protein